MMDKQKLIKHLRAEVKAAQQAMEEFRNRMALDVSALKRSDYAFRDAAELCVFTSVLNALEAPDGYATPESILLYARNRVFARKDVESFASATQNIFERCELGAWLSIFEIISYNV